MGANVAAGRIALGKGAAVARPEKYEPARDEMRMPGYCVRIWTAEVVPPLTGMSHCAHAAVYKDGSSRSEPCSLGQTYGSTKQEAIAEMRAQVRQWYDSQKKIV